MLYAPIRFRRALLSSLVLSSGALGLTGCASDAPARAAHGGASIGSVGLEIQLGDVRLDAVAYAITGNGFSKTGAIELSRSQTVSALLGGIPSGNGYTLALTGALTNDPLASCSATATFDIAAGATTTALVKLQCRLPNATGRLHVNGSANVCPRIDSVAIAPVEARVGGTIALAATITDTDALPARAGYLWSASGGGTLTGAASANAVFSCTTEGVFALTLVVSDGDCADTLSASVTCSASDAAAPAPAVKINEVESSGGVPGDWTELHNPGAAPVDISGFVFKDNDDTHAYVLPAGSVVPAGGFLVIEEAAQTFGLGGADAVRLFDTSGALVDSYTWTAHASTTYARCADGVGPFGTAAFASKGAPNSCAVVTPGSDAGASDAMLESGADASTASPWPGRPEVQTGDDAAQFTSNLSGLTYEPATTGSPAVLWAVVNGPGTLLRMLWNGSVYAPDPSNGWVSGKALRYPDGNGNPDAEGVTIAASIADGIYVATERNNDASTVSRLSVLRFDPNATGASLTAVHEWNLTPDLPVVGANLGLEAISWVPDSFLVGRRFYDQRAAHLYDPAEYPNHGAGLFFVGIEGNGQIYAYALDHVVGGFQRVATFGSGHIGIMGLEFDRETGHLWASCDDTCDNRSGILDIDTTPGSLTQGHFVVRRQFNRPSTLPNSNNEGIAIAPESECVDGYKPFFWSDDNDIATHSLRRGWVTCGQLP